MKNPQLLKGHSMAPAAMLHPSTMALSIKATPPSTCTLTMPLDDTTRDIKVGDWVQVWTPQDESIIFVVRTAQTNYTTQVVSLAMDHTISLLNDSVVFGKVTPETLGGDGATTISAPSAMAYLLGQQADPVWKMGRCGYSDAQGWQFGNKTVYTNLLNMAKSLDDPTWTFDQSTLPWTLNLVPEDKTVTCEMRQTRNLSTLNVSVDRSKLCTRIYPRGESNLDISGVNGGIPYLEKNVATWGLVSRIETDASIGEASMLKHWASLMLDKYSNPIVTVTISGLELSASTGEPFDRLTVGRYCRVPLPQYGTTITERIISLSWADAVANPDAVNVTLANNPTNIQGVLYKIQQASTGGGGSGSDKEEKEKDMYTIFEKTDEHILSMAVAKRKAQLAWAKQVIMADQIQNTVQQYNYTDAGDLLSSYYTQITQTATDIQSKAEAEDVNSLVKQTAEELSTTITSTKEGLESSIKQTKEGLESTVSSTAEGLQSQITQNKDAITAVVGDEEHKGTLTLTKEALESSIKSTKEGLESSIKQTKEGLESTVKSTKEGLESSIKQNSDRISAKVGNSEISLEGDGVKISGGTITLDGNVVVKRTDFETLVAALITADYIKTAFAGMGDATINGELVANIVNADSINSGPISCSGLTINSSTIESIVEAEVEKQVNAALGGFSDHTITIRTGASGGNVYHFLGKSDAVVNMYPYAKTDHNHDDAYAAKSHGHKWSEITDHPSFAAINTNTGKILSTVIPDLSGTYAKKTHTHSWTASSGGITDKPTIPDTSSFLTSVSWDDVTGKPSSFTPAYHTHSWTGASITNKPTIPSTSDFAAKDHNHDGTYLKRLPKHSHSGVAAGTKSTDETGYSVAT